MTTGWLYFITDGTAIKIGWTARDPFKRMREAQTHNPSLLSMYATCAGTRDEEYRLHRRLARHKTMPGVPGNEWHKANADVLAVIDEHLNRRGSDGASDLSQQRGIERLQGAQV